MLTYHNYHFFLNVIYIFKFTSCMSKKNSLFLTMIHIFSLALPSSLVQNSTSISPNGIPVFLKTVDGLHGDKQAEGVCFAEYAITPPPINVENLALEVLTVTNVGNLTSPCVQLVLGEHSRYPETDLTDCWQYHSHRSNVCGD